MVYSEFLDSLFYRNDRCHMLGGFDSFNNSNRTQVVHITLPVVGGNLTEVPVFSGIRKVNHLDYDEVCIALWDRGAVCGYEAKNKLLMSVLTSSFNSCGLVKFKCDEQTYYGTQGLLLSKDYKPLLMTSWEYNHDEEVGIPQRPVLRIDPELYTDKNSYIGKLFVRRAIPDLIKNGIYSYNTNEYIKVKVIIDTPTKIIFVDTPSADTTNKDVLQSVIDHIDDLQWPIVA